MRKLTLFVLVTAMLFVLSPGHASEITVYKAATCGCCNKWVDHLERAGFTVKAHNVVDVVEYKIRHGVSPELGSCHTALVDGYVIEGHVPADDIKRLLKERPVATGLAVPAMPMGSPGMEGHRKDDYEVVLFGRDGSRKVFARH
ncbi:MAG: DUF411 domain-containing protein [Gammaproteobacteria bacterium]|nr:DUF411 domain-containing protein [Gammaproteobacteria bacterium]